MFPGIAFVHGTKSEQGKLKSNVNELGRLAQPQIKVARIISEFGAE
jgi:hypothetical protein